MAGKNSLPPRESFKASSIRNAIAARFQGQERSLPNKGVGHSGTQGKIFVQKLAGKYLSIPAMKKCSGDSFVIVCPVVPKMAQVWEETALE